MVCNYFKFNTMRNLLLLTLIFGLFSCTQRPSCVIKVKLNNAEGKAFLSQLVRYDWVKIDSAEFKNSECQFNRIVKIPEVYFLSVSSKQGTLPFFIENTVISITGSIDSINKAKVSGSTVQDEFRALQDKLDVMAKQRIVFYNRSIESAKVGDKMTADSLMKMADTIFENYNLNEKNYIKANPASYVSPYFLNRVSFEMDADVLNGFLSGLDAKLDSVSIVIDLKELAAKRKAVAIGQIAPDFTMNDTDGNPVKLIDVYSKNTYTLIDFWASWCIPCRDENQKLLAIYNSYKTKGFGVIGVALEYNKMEWTKAIANDKLTWMINVSDLKGWENAARVLYEGGLGSNFLVDKTGKIVARDLHDEKLRETVAGLLK